MQVALHDQAAWEQRERPRLYKPGARHRPGPSEPGPGLLHARYVGFEWAAPSHKLRVPQVSRVIAVTHGIA